MLILSRMRNELRWSRGVLIMLPRCRPTIGSGHVQLLPLLLRYEAPERSELFCLGPSMTGARSLPAVTMAVASLVRRSTSSELTRRRFISEYHITVCDRFRSWNFLDYDEARYQFRHSNDDPAGTV